MDDNVMINIHEGPVTEHKAKWKPKKKTERMVLVRKQKRLSKFEDKKEITQFQAKIQNEENKAKNCHESNTERNIESVQNSKSEKTQSPKKRKRNQDDQGEGPVQKHGKFSSLFKSNPEIPVFNDLQTSNISEKVFSSNKFDELELHPFMVSNLENKIGVTEMTSVQKAAIPYILDGKDTLVKSQTGSGKTFAYAIPIVQHLQQRTPKVQRNDGTFAIVIVPTRELALQSFGAFQKLIQPFTWIVPGCIMGGEKRKSEKARLRKGINILVSTPGRLLDHIQHTDKLSLSKVKYLVIDEADRLLDMGFEKEVKQIIEALDKQVSQRQTILLSATLSAGVEKLAGMTLNVPVKIDMSDTVDNLAKPPNAKDQDQKDVFATPKNLRHHFVVVPHKLRLVSLIGFLIWKCKQTNKGNKILVFMSTQESVEFHNMLLTSCFKKLSFSYMQLFKLHGDMPQKERTNVFTNFKEAKAGILLCTDVAARGLDLPHVRWIVQYNAPESATDYIHRAGRTARIGGQGQAVLFLAPSETQYCQVLQEMNISLEELTVDTLLKSLLIEADVLKREGKQVPRTVEEGATALQMTLEEFVAENMEVRTMARRAYQSFVRAYATYPTSLKHIFHVKHLHLGHLAKSFSLQDSPKHIGDIIHNHASTFVKKNFNKKKGKSGNKKTGKKQRLDLISEYSSGISTKTKKESTDD